MTADNWKSDCQFSKKLAVLRLITDLSGRAGARAISKWADSKKQDWILTYLADSVSSIIKKYQNETAEGLYVSNTPIWVCWWSGEESAPPLVRQCLKSIRKNAGTHPVNFISQDNYQNWLNIPDYILLKVHSKKMCIANFSDYLRTRLINEYGGIWIDATVFLSASVPEDFFLNPFFTCKNKEAAEDSAYISRYRWTAFCISGWSHNVLFSFLTEALALYWKKHDLSIDYLLIDYIIETGYRNIPAIKKLIDSVPGNNVHRDDLQAAFNAALPASEFRNVIQSDTAIYKLSWRETYRKEFKGHETVYDCFLNMNIAEEMQCKEK